MTVRLFALVLATLAILPTLPQTPAMFDPVGTWRVSTVSDSGAPMIVTMNITGEPGAYRGSATTPERTIPLLDLGTTPTGMIAVFTLSDGFIVLRITRGAGGRLTGAWGTVEAAFPLTAQKGK